jgi:alkanesulfonate monooxygenase SsuD/methylene tetrahydromethanopterin reductase-like flavin-dependent oxidoreductase (luciferase family)
VKVGVTIPATELATGRPRSFQEMAAEAISAERLGYDSAWVMDHVFVARDGVRSSAGPEPLTLLAYLAARTERIALGTLVLCAPFRPPAQLAREAKTLQQASGGRFLLGVGSGWYQPEFDAFGFPFDHLVGRFEEYLEVLTRLLGEGPASFEGSYQVLREGEVIGGAAPRPWVAGSGPRMLRLTGRLAGGWNSAWHGADPSLFSRRLAEVEAALAAAGRQRSELEASAGLLVLPGAAEDSAGEVIGGTPETIVKALERYRAAGCDHAILNFAPKPFREVDPGFPALLAPHLDRMR